MLNIDAIRFLDCGLCGGELLPLYTCKTFVDPEYGLCGHCVLRLKIWWGHKIYVTQASIIEHEAKNEVPINELNKFLAEELHKIAIGKKLKPATRKLESHYELIATRYR